MTRAILTGRTLSEDFILRAKCFGFLTSIVGAGFGITICAIGSGIYIGFLLIQVFAVKTYDWHRFPLTPIAVLLLISLTVSLFISDYFYISLRGYWKYLEGFFLFYAGIDLVRNKQIARLVFIALFTSLSIALAAGLWQHFFGYDFIYFRNAVVYRDVVLRIIGPFKHCNDYATYLVPAFALFSALSMCFVQKRHFGRALISCLMLAGFSWVLILTISRGALLSVFFSMIIFISCFKFRRWAYLGLFLTAVAVICVPSTMSERFQNIFENAGSTPERMVLLETTWRMVMENPVFGLGLNTYSDYFPRFRPSDYPAIMYTHNSYLQIASEAGLLGSFLYIGFQILVVVSVFRKALRIQNYAQKVMVLGLAAGLCGIMANAFVESLFQSTQLRTHYWSLLGIAVGIAYRGGFEADR